MGYPKRPLNDGNLSPERRNERSCFLVAIPKPTALPTSQQGQTKRDLTVSGFMFALVLVYCLVNLFRNWQDLWRPPMLFGFCPELLGRRHARCSVLVPSYVVKGNGLSRQPAQRLSRSYLAGWLAGLDPGRNVRPCSSRKRWWV